MDHVSRRAYRLECRYRSVLPRVFSLCLNPHPSPSLALPRSQYPFLSYRFLTPYASFSLLPLLPSPISLLHLFSYKFLFVSLFFSFSFACSVVAVFLFHCMSFHLSIFVFLSFFPFLYHSLFLYLYHSLSFSICSTSPFSHSFARELFLSPSLFRAVFRLFSLSLCFPSRCIHWTRFGTRQITRCSTRQGRANLTYL